MEPDVLERILDGREKPTNLPLALLKNITLHFSKEREIGHGGFATVYKGVLSNGNVAVKRIQNIHTIDERLFYREVDSLMVIKHQNIVRFVGFCASTDQIAIKIEGSREHIYAEIRERLLCFEYISNGSLQKYITDELRGLDWSTRYRLIKGICDGLHYLHTEMHIYHMDLKPANILLDNDMVPKITDFGLSRLDEKSQTMNVDRRGTPGYCAPEYLQRGKMSFKSDIYSLGIIIIELVTGEKSIPDNNKNNVLRRWRHRWKKTGEEIPLCYQQVTKFIDVGLLCQEIDPCKRPFISDIIHDISKMECTTGKISVNATESTFGQINPYLEDDMLGIEPLELHFPFELNKQMSCSLQLTNETDSYIAFNIQKTRPLPYCTQPDTNIVPPRSKCSVDITLQPQDKAPRDMQHADEFIVRSTRVNDDIAVEDITTEMFNKETNSVVDEVNLDVVFDAQLQSELLDDVLNSVQQAECAVQKGPLEEPSSSFSEAAEDDPLPAIDGLRITGEAFPGREIQASGYSINRTTSCKFEWVRHLEDGSVNYIEARQPTYLVTADDVDSLLAIEVQPLDDRKRKGEIVKVYANEQRKITCDPEMKELIKKILSIGHVSFEVLLPVRFIDMWEPAVLAIKREGYSIKCNGHRGVVITEKFQQATTINIPYGCPIEFSIQSADGAKYNLKPAESSPSRDSIVLILRLFRMKAVEKSKGRASSFQFYRMSPKGQKGIFFPILSDVPEGTEGHLLQVE